MAGVKGKAGRKKRVGPPQDNLDKYKIVGLGGFWCKECEKFHPVDDMVKHRTSKYGVRNTCKSCKYAETKRAHKANPEKRKEYQKKYVSNNRDKVREANKRYAEKNPDKIREYNRKYQQNNPDKVKESNKKWYEKNKEKCLMSQKIWKAKNPEKVKEYAKKHYDNNSDKIISKQNERREAKKEKQVDDFFSDLGWQ